MSIGGIKVTTLCKKVLKLFGYVIVSVALGCLLMILVYKLPTEPMAANIARSSEIFNYEGVYPSWTVGYKSTQLDNWTEGYVLCSAIYPVKNTVKDAMNNPIIEYEGERITLSLTLQANKVPGETFSRGYGRYWHGLLVVLKPLLLFFDVGDIRILNMMLQMVLLLGITVSLVEKGYKKIIPSLVLAVIIINPVTIPMSFTFSAEYILMLIACLIVVNKHTALKKKDKYFEFFCILGCMTAFFNEMSYPVVTLGIPLFLYLVMEEKEWKQKVVDEVSLSASWVLGYGGMWIGKWVCGSLLTGNNYFLDAFSQANSYVVTDITEPSILDRIWKNISVIARWPYVIIILVVILWFIVEYRKVSFDEKYMLSVLKENIPFFMLALYPFVTYIALGNGYSYNHYWFSYRLLAITAAAGSYLFRVVKKDNCKLAE